jgi:hypothetical protein
MRLPPEAPSEPVASLEHADTSRAAAVRAAALARVNMTIILN